MTTPNLILTPRKSALLAEHDNTLDVLVQIQAPELPRDQRPKRLPLHLALVLDRSGSMSGQPLEEAKRCAQFVIDSLDPSDRASLVVYDNRVDTLVQTRDLEDREIFRRAIRGIEARGTTDLHGGWQRGAETLKLYAGNRSLSRVILLSDGCANQGITELSSIAEQCRASADTGVTTSTYGLGHHFNEDLMVAMGRAGQGNHYYGQTAEDLMDPFREEFALLNALCARSLELELSTIDGAELEVMNAYTKNTASTWRLPDLAYGADAWALVRVRLPKERGAALSSQESAALLTVGVRYHDIGGVHLALEPQTLSLPVLASSAFEAVAADPLVQRRIEELEAAAIQETARLAALENDWGKVDYLLGKIRKLGMDNEWVKEIERELRSLAERHDGAMFAKEARYAASKMSSRLASRGEMDESLDAVVPDFLRRKMAQGKRDRR
jgi:Ca-activated chloride channel family protein